MTKFDEGGKKMTKRRAVIGWVEHPSPKQLKRGDGWFGELDRVYRQGNEYIVMVRDVPTEWGIVQHACMRNNLSHDIPWAEKQRIKNEIFGKEAQAIEVFPKESLLVDEANMYHIWLLPADMYLPFGLKDEEQKKRTNLLSKHEREEVITIILLKKNYAEDMLQRLSDEELLKLLDEQ